MANPGGPLTGLCGRMVGVARAQRATFLARYAHLGIIKPQPLQFPTKYPTDERAWSDGRRRGMGGMAIGLLRGEGWTVNHKRIERLWRREGLKVPQKQPKRGRLWLADGSCIRRRPEYRHHVWAYDFVADRTQDGRPLKILTIVEEYSRECLAIIVARWLRSIDVLETLAALFVRHGVPAHIRSDNGPEFTAELIRRWLEALQVQTLFIEPGSPWENGYVESFNGKLRDELLDREIFYTLTEAQILIERWRRQYNTVRPHSALGYRPPAPEAIMPAALGSVEMCPALS